jgi:hypothetical protein
MLSQLDRWKVLQTPRGIKWFNDHLVRFERAGAWSSRECLAERARYFKLRRRMRKAAP